MAEDKKRGVGVEDIFLVLIVLAGLGLAWFLSGGPSKTGPESESPFILSPIQIGSGSSLFPTDTESGSGYSEEIERASEDVVKINQELALAGDPAERSTLFEAIVIENSTAGFGSQSANEEYLTLRASRGNAGPIAISGWTLKSALTGRSATIPNGTRVPQTGSVNYEEPILLYPGEEAIVVSGRSPIGVSFKENRCTGYLSQFQQFNPSLSTQCPRPDAELSFATSNVGNDNRCLSYLEGMSRCRIETSPLPDDLSSDCRNFIATHITYNGCVANHKNEPTFLGKTWRVYLRFDQTLWKERREVIKLLDGVGKTVDVFTY